MEKSPSASLYTRYVAQPLFALHERLKGHDTVRKLEALERSQWLPAGELARVQAAGLGAFLERACARHDYWRRALAEAGIAASEFGDPTALERLPPTDKETVRRLAGQWQPRAGERFGVVQTSGSTGEPLRIPVGMDRVAHDVAAKWRATRWWGVDIGDPEIVVWASPRETATQSRVKRLRDAILRTRLLPIRAVDAATACQYAEAIRRFAPRMMFGYPSMLSQLARVAMDTGAAPEPPPRVAFTTSEILRPKWRAAIEAGFATRVADEYGARDAGFLARECPSGKMHVNTEDVVLEIVDDDGRRVPAGRVGHVLVTNTTTALFPFIRYRTGDLASLDDAPCSCGRAHPVIRELAGRVNDCLLRSDGARVHGSAFNYVLRDVAEIEAYQLRQSRLDLVTVLVRVSAPLGSPLRRRIGDEFRALLGQDVAIEICEVSGFAAGPGGKHRHVMCEVDPAYAKPAALAESGESR